VIAAVGQAFQPDIGLRRPSVRLESLTYHKQCDNSPVHFPRADSKSSVALPNGTKIAV
jgi:hypothetical protein